MVPTGSSWQRGHALLLAAALGVAGFALARHASAAEVASDNASNYTSSTWPPGSSLGSGFSAWTYTAAANGGSAGSYLDTSGKNIATSTGTGAGSANTAKASWGLYANTPQSGKPVPRVDFTRDFVAGSGTGVGTLRAGQSFSVALQTDGIGNAGQAFGFNLQTGTGSAATTVFSLQYAGGVANNNVTIVDANGSNNSASPAITFANIQNGIDATFTLDSPTAYTLTVSPAAGNTTFTSPTPYTYTGTVSGAVNQFDVFDQNTTGNGYFNSVAVTGAAAVPEPATLGLLGVGALAMLRRKGKRTA